MSETNATDRQERLTAYLLLRSEIVDDVEELANLLRRLALDHVRDCLATDITVGFQTRRYTSATRVYML